MPLVDKIKRVALAIVNQDDRFANHTDADLMLYTLSSGYALAREPHASTADLLYVYAANLRNRGGPGVPAAVFGSLIRSALAPTIDNNVIPQINQSCIAQRLLDHHKALPVGELVLQAKTLDRLANIANGDIAHGGQTGQILQSIEGFISFLNCNEYNYV